MVHYAPFLFKGNGTAQNQGVVFMSQNNENKSNKIGAFLKKEFTEFKVLMRNVPTVIVLIFVMSLFAMNLLANKSISLNLDWLALDTGIIVSWFAFLTMDIITKHFGAKASTQISIFAIFINLIFCFLFFIGSIIPGLWGESFVEVGGETINKALDSTFGGTWYVLLGSIVAFLTSAVVNNFTNWGIGKLFKKRPDSAVAFFLRSYVSTALGQFIDNLVFAFIVSFVFFGWSPLQCVMCALTGIVAELLCEIVFSPFGYAICKKWKNQNIGAEYFELRKKTV